MKKIILIAIVLVFLFFTFMIIGAKATENDNASNIDEIRAVYFSYIEFNSYIKGKKSEESKNNIKNLLRQQSITFEIITYGMEISNKSLRNGDSYEHY